MPHFDNCWIVFESQLSTDSFFNFVFLFFCFFLKPTKVIIIVVVIVTVVIVIVVKVIVVGVVVVIRRVRSPICRRTSGDICGVGSIRGRVRYFLGRRISGKCMSWEIGGCGRVCIRGGSGTRSGCIIGSVWIVVSLLCWNGKKRRNLYNKRLRMK